MAYIASIDHKCRTCGRRATVEVVDCRNEPRGKYCAKCSTRALAAEKEREARLFGPGKAE